MTPNNSFQADCTNGPWLELKRWGRRQPKGYDDATEILELFLL